MVRGINKQDIFHDDEDRDIFIERLFRYKKESLYKIYAYCLMSNHVHLLIREGNESFSDVMKKIGVSYVYYYNQKYNRIGHLFQDRFKSEAVEDDRYLLTVTRYIHQNPVKINLPIDCWTSYNDYINDTDTVDTDLIFGILSENKEDALKVFVDYMNKTNDDTYLDMSEQKRLSDVEATDLIKDICGITACNELQYINTDKRDAFLSYLKESGISIRQIARITGLNRGVVLNA
jgi:REP element-mobilizing transposase RayT